MFNLATYPWVSFLCTLAEYCSSVYTTSLCPLRAANISGVDPFSSLQSTSTWTDSVFDWMSSGGAAGLSGLSGSVEVSPMGSRLRRPMLSSRRSFESKRLRRDLPLRSCCGRVEEKERREVEERGKKEKREKEGGKNEGIGSISKSIILTKFVVGRGVECW